WLSPDPLCEESFLTSYVRNRPATDTERLREEALLPPYRFIQNDGVNHLDVNGLREPDVKWAPPLCKGKGVLTGIIQVVVGFWGRGGAHVDNGSTGGGSDASTGCPLYPVPFSEAFQDSPFLAGKSQFITCRVCLEKCCYIKRGVKGVI